MFGYSGGRIVWLGIVLLASLFASAQQKLDLIADGRRALMQGNIADALSKLNTVTATNPQNGEAHLLLCRAYYAEHSADDAVRECEAALQTLSKSSQAQDWMGRAYGMKAEHAGPLSGYSLAKKVKASFEVAVAQDPGNGDAIDDLGDYYVQAPSIVGGGIDKAKALAERVQSRNRAQALRLLASIAEKEKDYSAVERDLREHVRVTNGRPDTWLDLAGFYQKRNELDRALDALHHAQDSAHDRSSILVAIAEMLGKIQREPALAMANLQQYLAGGNTDDSAPTFKAHVMLGKLFQSRGDKAAAKIEFNKALTLAPDYEPAKKALAAL